jgi:hypothetical protein
MLSGLLEITTYSLHSTSTQPEAYTTSGFISITHPASTAGDVKVLGSHESHSEKCLFSLSQGGKGFQPPASQGRGGSQKR